MSALREGLIGLLGALARPIYGGVGCILVFHRVLSEEERSTFPENRALEITPEDLRAILTWVRERRIEPISLDEIPERLSAPRGRKFVAFTFDDGYRDNLEHALPIFREFGIPFAVNITTGFIDASEPAWWYALEKALRVGERFESGETKFDLPTPAARHAALEKLGQLVRKRGLKERDEFVNELCEAVGIDAWRVTRGLMLTRDELRRLASDSLVTIGAHSVGHHCLNGLDEEEVKHELGGARTDLEAFLGRPVNHLAFPFGGRNAVGAREFRLAAECGFTTAMTTRSANLFPAHSAQLDRLPRLGVSGNYPAVLRLRKIESGLLPGLRAFGRRVITE